MKKLSRFNVTYCWSDNFNYRVEEWETNENERTKKMKAVVNSPVDLYDIWLIAAMVLAYKSDVKNEVIAVKTIALISFSFIGFLHNIPSL